MVHIFEMVIQWRIPDFSGTNASLDSIKSIIRENILELYMLFPLIYTVFDCFSALKHQRRFTNHMSRKRITKGMAGKGMLYV